MKDFEDKNQEVHMKDFEDKNQSVDTNNGVHPSIVAWWENHRRKATHHVSMIQHTLTRLTMDLNNALCLLGCTAEEGMNDAEEFAFLDSEFSINERSCIHGKYLPFKDGDCYEDHNYTPFDLLLEVPKSVGRTVLEDLIPTLHELREVIHDWRYCTKEKKKEEKEKSTG